MRAVLNKILQESHAPISDARPLIPPHCHLLPLSFARSANHAVRGPSGHLRAQAPVPPHRRARRSARTQPPSSALPVSEHHRPPRVSEQHAVLVGITSHVQRLLVSDSLTGVTTFCTWHSMLYHISPRTACQGHVIPDKADHNTYILFPRSLRTRRQREPESDSMEIIHPAHP